MMEQVADNVSLERWRLYFRPKWSLLGTQQLLGYERGATKK